MKNAGKSVPRFSVVAESSASTAFQKRSHEPPPRCHARACGLVLHDSSASAESCYWHGCTTRRYRVGSARGALILRTIVKSSGKALS